jgi:photosystem II stability/assembly factor-like uncharacterized protein
MNSIPVSRVVPLPVRALLAWIPIAAIASAQSASWTRQAPLPTGSDLYTVQVVSQAEAWAAGGPGTLVHTTDGGAHWQSTKLATESLFALCFLDAQHGWAAGNGFFHTTNGGQSWTRDNALGSVYDLCFVDALRGFACGNGGVTYRTTDGGLTWSAVAVGSTSTLSSIAFVDAQRGWTLDIDGRIYSSLDGGQSWTLQWNANGAYLSTLQFLDALEGWAIGGNTFLHTTNGGASWIAAAVPPGTWSHGAAFFDRQHGVSVGEYGNITVTADGGAHWSTVRSIGSGPRLWDVGFASGSRGFYCGETGALSLTTDGGLSWLPIQSGGYGETHAIHAFDAAHAWAASDGGEILRTVDGGALWERTVVAGFDVYGRILDIEFVDASRGWAVGRQDDFGIGYGRIARTDDGGRTWDLQLSVDEAYFQAVEALGPTTAIAFGNIPQGPSVWMRTVDGGLNWTNVAPSAGLVEGADFVDASIGWAVGARVHKTTNGGATWTEQQFPPDLLNAVSFADAQNGWAVGWSATLLHTTDGGAHWLPQNPGTGSSTVLLAVKSLSPTTAWIAGTGAFVARTTNGGATWQPESVPGADPGLPFESAAFLDAEHGWIGGYGVWRREGGGGCASPRPYCAAKQNSSGGFATIGWDGVPSVASGPFSIVVSGGLPQKLGLFFASAAGPASIPFHGGTLCLQSPFTRLPVLRLDATGSAVQPIAVIPVMVGTTRWYQLFHRDPANPDGTGLALSNGLAVDFCN